MALVYCYETLVSPTKSPQGLTTHETIIGRNVTVTDRGILFLTRACILNAAVLKARIYPIPEEMLTEEEREICKDRCCSDAAFTLEQIIEKMECILYLQLQLDIMRGRMTERI
jgi:hypothetical protein